MSTNIMDSGNCVKVLKALGDDTRLRILDYLFYGESSVSDIADGVGVEFSQVSHHLRVLRNAGLVSDSKNGKYVIYRLDSVIHNQKSKKNMELDFECCSIKFNAIGYKNNYEA